jgi:hypothetical protein
MFKKAAGFFEHKKVEPFELSDRYQIKRGKENVS